MNIFTNKDIKNFFILLSCIFIAFICLSQLYVLLSYGSFNTVLLLFSALIVAVVLSCCFLYFRRQNQIIDDAISTINRFISGDTGSRIECDNEGSLYKLFHAINTLATTLDAHATKEQDMKEFLKDIISDISHQLKTPLAALAIYNSLLQDESEDKTVMQEFALKSQKEIDRIQVLVQNLLKITKLDAGSIIMEKHTENVAEMMNDIRLHFETRAEMEQKTIDLSGPVDTELLCDRGWILEAVSNIVKNALDHTEAGSHIAIAWSGLPAVTQIIVKDNGSGIHPEDIHHIFKRFYRSRFSKDTQGIGLGLPLAKTIVEAHNGNITVDSILNEGSVFVMSFLKLT